MIEQMDEQARLLLAESTWKKPQARIAADHNGNAIVVCARLLSGGKMVLGYSYGGVRLRRNVLMQLLCTATACPRCQGTQANWNVFLGIASAKIRTGPQTFQFRHLAEEVVLDVNGRSCAVRPATSQCFTVCPVKVHAPEVVRRAGWDLFEGGKYIAGGLIADPATKMQTPTFPTIEAAKTLLADPAHAASPMNPYFLP